MVSYSHFISSSMPNQSVNGSPWASRFRLSAQMACRYAVLTRCARSAAAKQHATCARPSFQLPTDAGSARYAISAMAPVTSMLGK